MRRWLQAAGEGEQIEEQRRRLQRRDEFIALLLDVREELREAYESTETDVWKRDQKQTIIQRMRERYRSMAERWQYTGYDRWFEQDLNNAHFISAAAYHSRVPAFTALLHSVPDIDTFWKEVKRISKLPVAARNEALDQLQTTATATRLKD